jgi:predicted Zn-dependent peptidase
MEERRRSYESNPDGKLYETLIADAFTAHPYRHPIIGWNSDIDHLSLAETREFLRKYYSPVNTVIALVGDIDAGEAIEMVGKYFERIEPGTPVPPNTTVEPPQQGEKRRHILFDAEPRLAIAYHKPTLPERDDYVFDLIDNILSQGRTSRLYRSLVVEQELATSVGTYGAPGSRYPNLFVVSAVPRHPHTTREVEEAIYAELERLAREPVTAEELVQARNRLRVDQLRSLKENGGLARMLTYYQTVAGDWRYVVDYDEIVATITADEVMEAARTYFDSSRRTVITLGKGGE